MENKTVQEMTDIELVERVGSVAIGTPSGMKAQEAQAELTRRLMVSIQSMDKTTEHYSFRLLGLTYLLFMATVLLIVLTAMMLELPLFVRFIIIIGSIGLLSWAMFDWFKKK